MNTWRSNWKNAIPSVWPDDLKNHHCLRTIWAIGTNKNSYDRTGSKEIHAYLRSVLAKKYGQEVADEISILYGGGVKATNAKII